MSRISNKNTIIEILLCKKLWESGIRYRKNYKKLPGSPDIAITKYKIAIFCDGEFWHGKDWDLLKYHFETKTANGDKWIKKIQCTIERDRQIEAKLNGLGWHVLRFWGKDIKKNPDNCVKVVKELIFDISLSEPLPTCPD